MVEHPGKRYRDSPHLRGICDLDRNKSRLYLDLVFPRWRYYLYAVSRFGKRHFMDWPRYIAGRYQHDLSCCKNNRGCDGIFNNPFEYAGQRRADHLHGSDSGRSCGCHHNIPDLGGSCDIDRNKNG